MILDCMENAARYAGTAQGLQKMLAAEAEYAAQGATGGRKLYGDRMYINDCRYETQPADDNARLEAHRRYIDVMFMIEGEETILVKPVDRAAYVTQAYDEAGDALLAKLDGDETAVRLTAGQFIVLFPQDAHCPARQVGKSGPVHKLIGKLAVDFVE